MFLISFSAFLRALSGFSVPFVVKSLLIYLALPDK